MTSLGSLPLLLRTVRSLEVAASAQRDEMAGYRMSSVEAARKFLYQFHDESLIEQAQQELPVGQVYVPGT